MGISFSFMNVFHLSISFRCVSALYCTGSRKRAALSALDHASPSKKNGERFAAISTPRVICTKIAPGNTNAATTMLKITELMHAPVNPNNSSQVFRTYTVYSLYLSTFLPFSISLYQNTLATLHYPALIH